MKFDVRSTDPDFACSIYLDFNSNNKTQIPAKVTAPGYKNTEYH